MAEYRSPVVPDLPRLTGGAVGFFGYDAAPWFEPALDGVWERERGRLGDPAGEAAFMLFDTVLAFDHVRHRILLIANARVTPARDLESLYQFACARIQFLERELAGGLSRATTGGGEPPIVEARTSRESSRRRSAPPRSTSPPATSTRWCCRSATTCASPPIRSPCIARCGT